MRRYLRGRVARWWHCLWYWHSPRNEYDYDAKQHAHLYTMGCAECGRWFWHRVLR